MKGLGQFGYYHLCRIGVVAFFGSWGQDRCFWLVVGALDSIFVCFLASPCLWVCGIVALDCSCISAQSPGTGSCILCPLNYTRLSLPCGGLRDGRLFPSLLRLPPLRKNSCKLLITLAWSNGPGLKWMLLGACYFTVWPASTIYYRTHICL